MRDFGAAFALLETATAGIAQPGRYAGHALLLGLAIFVAGTATITPVHRAVNQALESFAIDDPGLGDGLFLRPSEADGQPSFPPPDDQTLQTLKPRPSVVTHVVEPGDTVNKLADKYKITANTIVWANNLTDPNKLPVGHAILILPMSGVLHTLKSGETLEAVAQRYQIEPSVILDANGLALDKALPPSTQIVIPGGRPIEPDRAELSTRAVERPNPAGDRPALGGPAVTAPIARPTPVKPLVYEVQEGDSVLSIARRFGISAGTIVQANGIGGVAADDLKVGQKLRVLPIDGLLHKVAEGDMVRALAALYGADTSAIIKTNALPEPYVLQPGQEIIIPGGRVPDAPPEPAAAPQPPAPAVPYKVEAGDSVVSIAERFGLEPRQLARYNGLDRADLISPGQSLLLPPGSRMVSAGAAAARSIEPPASAPAAAPPPRPQRGPLQAAAALVRPIVQPPPPPAPAPRPVVPTDNWGVVAIASKYLGYAYVWGGQGPGGFDCTGFTWYVYKQAGRSIPLHDLWGQLQSGPRVGRDSLRPGDLVFFQNTYMAGLSHVGIYMGGGRFVNAQSERAGVTVASMNDPYWGSRYVGATRP